MKQKTLQELLKPPFRTGDVIDNIKDERGIVVYCNSDLFYDHLASWKYSNSDKLRIELAEFVATALNEKAEREWGEPLRWIKKCIYGMYVIFCPKCDFSTSMNGIMDDDFKYCPHCGQKLAEPEKGE